MTRSNDELARRVHLGLLIALLLIMGTELTLLLVEGLWMSAFLVLGVIAICLGPLVLRRHFAVSIPAELQVLVIVFVFAALFLGEIRSYYERIWWWDIALHTSSGLLLGILGFLLVYVLNENENVDIDLHPGFVAFFAFLFAVAIGAVWEIFEFAMDRSLGTTMQKPMLGDASGLTDTMWDLIVDALGALAISSFGWWFMKRDAESFIELWIRKFIGQNPQLFRR